MSRLEIYDTVWYREDIANYFKKSLNTVTNWKKEGVLPEYDVVISGKVCG